MGVFDNLTTQQKAIFGIGGGAALLFLFMRGAGKKGGTAGGALAVVDVRRPTDDINAPAGVGAGPGGGRWQQVLNVNPMWGQDPMGWDRPGPGAPKPQIPPTQPPNRHLAQMRAQRDRLKKRALDVDAPPGRINRITTRIGELQKSIDDMRKIDPRNPKMVEGSKPVMPQGPPVEDIPHARPSQRGIHGSIINGELDYLQQGNIPIYGSIMDSGR